MASTPDLTQDETVPLRGGGKEQHFMGSCYSSKTKDGKDNSTVNMPGSRPKSNANQTKGLRYPGSASKERGSATSLDKTAPMVVNANLRRSKSSISKLSSSSQSLDIKNANKQTNNASTSSASKAAPESKIKSRFGFGSMLRRKDDENSNKTSSQTSINSQSSHHGGSMEKISKPDKGSKSSPLVECKNRNNLDNSKNDALSKSSAATKSGVIQRSSPGAAKRPVSAEYKVESKALKSDRSCDVQGAKSSAISSQLSSRLPVGGRGPLLSKLQQPKVKPQSHTDHFAAKNISPYPSPQIPRNFAAKPAVSRWPSKVHNANQESTYNQQTNAGANEESGRNGVEKVEENGNCVCEKLETNLTMVSSESTEKPGVGLTGKATDASNQDNVSTTSSVRNLIAQAKRVSLTLNGSERFTPDSLPDTPFNKRAPLATFDSSVEGSSFASLLSDDMMLDYDEDEELEKMLCKSAASTPGEEKSIMQQFAMAQRLSPGDEKSVLQQFALRKMRPRSRSVEALRKKSLGKSPLTIDSTATKQNDCTDSAQNGSNQDEVHVEKVQDKTEEVTLQVVEEVCVSELTVDVEQTPIIEEEVAVIVHSPVENRPKTLQLDLPRKVKATTKITETETGMKAESKLSAPKTLKESKLVKKSGLAQPSSKLGQVKPSVKSAGVQSTTKLVTKPEKTDVVVEKVDKVAETTDKVSGKPPAAGARGSLPRKVSYGEKKAPLVRSATDDPNRTRSHTFSHVSELNQLMQETSPAKPPHLRARSQSSPLKPPRPRSVSSIDEEDYVQMDGYNYRHIMQDVTTFKTMLHKLKRQLQEDELCSPFEVEDIGRLLPLGTYRGSSFGSDSSAPGGGALPDTGSMKRQRFRETSQGTSLSSVTSLGMDDLVEENTGLRHQVAVLQRQLEEKERTIKLFQQQMTKYSTGVDEENPCYQCTATQTDEDLQQDNKTNSRKLQKGTLPQKGPLPQKTHVNAILDEVTRKSNEGAENFRNKLNAVEDTFTSMTGNLRNAHRSFSQTSLNHVK